MDKRDATKASNALVAVVDFYGTAMGDLSRQLDEKMAAIAVLTEHNKSQAAEVKRLDEELYSLAEPVRALLRSRLTGVSSDQNMRELKVAYERTIGPVELAGDPEDRGGPGQSPAGERG